jgi:type IV secretory pathway TrbF-like protein
MQSTIPSKQKTKTGAAVEDTLEDLSGTRIAQPKSQEYSPYLAARHEWDERYGGLVARTKKAETIAALCAGIALVSTLALVVMLLRSAKIVVVAVNSAGQFIGSGISGQSLGVTRDMKRGALADWVSNLRLVTPDGISQKWAIEKVYSMISSGSSAQAVVSDYYRSAPPQTRARSQTVHVEINTVLPTSDSTYEVEWLETIRDLQGKVLAEQRWKGAFTFVISSKPPNDERLLRFNPIGLYITQANLVRVL